jgi:hypothetical protein
MPFVLSCLLFALLPAGLALLFGLVCVRWPEVWRQLPRERNIGIAIGAVCLVWSAYYALPMLEGGLAKYRPLIKILVPVTTVLAYLFLNYVFTRAMGGLMMIAATYMLHQAFVAHLPLRPVFSLICYVVAVAGMFALAAPWHFRDLLHRAAERASWRHALTLANGCLAVGLLVFALLGL